MLVRRDCNDEYAYLSFFHQHHQSSTKIVHVQGMRPEDERTFKSIYSYGYGKMLVLALGCEEERFVLDFQV